MLKKSSTSTFLLLPVVPTRSQLLNPGHPSRLFTIALPFVDVLLHLEVEVGTSQVGPGSEKFEDILLLHLQDIEASGHCGVSLWKQRQGTCGEGTRLSPAGPRHEVPPPRPPSWAASRATPGRPRPSPRLGRARPARRQCAGMHSAPRCYRRAGNAPPAAPTPCGPDSR